MKKSIVSSVALVAGMFAAASLLEEYEIIFPEIAALAVGAWIMPELPWEGRTINLWLSPTLGALTGMVIIKYFPYDTFFMIGLALILVIIQLRLFNSRVFPSISAAILPILVNASSWLYPASVCLLTGIICIGRLKTGENAAGRIADRVCEKRSSFGYWATISCIVLMVAACAVYFDFTYLLAPPLIVVFVEFTQPDSRIGKKGLQVFFLLVLAAFSGVILFYLTQYCMHWPLWVSSILSLIWLFLLYDWFKIKFPPAAAITLLPSIIPAESLWSYPFQVSLGCVLFITTSILIKKFHRREEQKGGGQE